MKIDRRAWEHWVTPLHHEIKLEYSQDDYRVRWPSGNGDNAKLIINGEETQIGNWIHQALRAQRVERGLDPYDRNGDETNEVDQSMTASPFTLEPTSPL
jgi:hypothetical protein